MQQSSLSNIYLSQNRENVDLPTNRLAPLRVPSTEGLSFCDIGYNNLLSDTLILRNVYETAEVRL